MILELFGPGVSSQNRPTALVSHDENVAAIAMQTLAEVGQRVPQNVSLAGFGDTPRLAEALTPSLTVVRQPVAEIAKAAIAALYHLHEAETLEVAIERDISLPGRLVTRASCGSPLRV